MMPMHILLLDIKLESTEILEIAFFVNIFWFSNKMMLLESLAIPLTLHVGDTAVAQMLSGVQIIVIDSNREHV